MVLWTSTLYFREMYSQYQLSSCLCFVGKQGCHKIGSPSCSRVETCCWVCTFWWAAGWHGLCLLVVSFPYHLPAQADHCLGFSILHSIRSTALGGWHV